MTGRRRRQKVVPMAATEVFLRQLKIKVQNSGLNKDFSLSELKEANFSKNRDAQALLLFWVPSQTTFTVIGEGGHEMSTFKLIW